MRWACSYWGLSAPSTGKAVGASPPSHLACSGGVRRDDRAIRGRLTPKGVVTMKSLMQQLLGLSAPSTGEAGGATPLTLASLVPAVRLSTPSTGISRRSHPPHTSLRSFCRWLSAPSIIGVQHPLHRQSRRSLPAHTSLPSGLLTGSAPPPRALPAEPPPSPSLFRRV